MFADQWSVLLSSRIVSATVKIDGRNAAAPIAVINGKYSIDGAPFTDAPGLVANGAKVRVKHTSAGAPGTSRRTTLTIGGVSATFSSTTAMDTTPDPFRFIDRSGVAVSTRIVSDPVTITGIDALALISVAGGQYSIDGGAFTDQVGVVTNGATVRVRHTSAAGSGVSKHTTLTVGGVSDTFTSTTK